MAEQTTALATAETPDEVGTPNPLGAKAWRARVAQCKRIRDHELLPGWSDNVSYRRGKPFRAVADSDRVNVNLDWPLTKSKHAQLFSQMPQAYLTEKKEQFKAAVPAFGKQLNDTITTASTGAAVDECVVDAVNAAGFGAALVGYRSTTRMKTVPTTDPSTLPPEMQSAVLSGQFDLNSLGTEEVPETVDRQFYVKRISPSDFLWPIDFTGSNFDDADWLGYSGRMQWAEAQREFKLTDEHKSTLLQGGNRRESLRQDSVEDGGTDPLIEYDEIFYWRHRFDADEVYYKRLYRLVLVGGIDEPIINEQWDGQAFVEGIGYVGACKNPVRVLTLTYISDDAIPPSDTAIGRPQVLEMIKSRTQIIEQRDRSKPVRWYDTNRVDPMVQDLLNRGTNQAFVPIQGDGERAIGEVARANYPREDFEFDGIIKSDLQEQWQVGSNQLGSYNTGRRSAREAAIVQGNFQTRIGYERSRVAAFIAGIAEVLAGLIALYSEFPSLDEQVKMGMDASWDRRTISGEFVYYLRPDSTVLLDAEQRIEKLIRLLNLVGKSPFVDPIPLITEIVELHGIDPNRVVHAPQPPRPDQPNISYRFSGEDLLNPMAVALLEKSGHAPNPNELAAAIKIIQAAIASIQPGGPPVPGSGQGGPGGQGGSGGPGAPQPPPGSTPQPVGDVRPEWGPIPRITKRTNEPGG